MKARTGKATRTTLLLAVCLGLAGGLPARAGDAAAVASPGAPAAERVPELRMIDVHKDASPLRRIAALRANLPAQYRQRNNFAWAVAKIDGLEKTEFFAHSAIQDLESLSSVEAGRIAGISLRCARPDARFTVWCVNQRGVVAGPDCWERDVDTECKILEDLAARLADPDASGCIRLYTDLPPCPSCWNVMKQFLACYPHVRMQVLCREHGP